MQIGYILLPLSIVFATFFRSAYAVDCISAYDSSANYFPFAFNNDSDPFALPLGAVTVNTAFDFTVQYSNSYKIVRNMFSNDTYVLYQCGTPSPAGYSSSAKVKLIEIPVKGIALVGSTPIPYLELLGLLSQVKQADNTTTPYIVSACMQKILSESKIANLNTSSNILVIENMFTSSGAKNYISFDSTTDPGPLKRAEWIKFLSLFFNLEAEASAIFQTIKNNYDCFNGSSSPSIKPTVAWMDYYDGVWTVSDKQYKKDLVKDAGGVSLADNLFGMYNMSNSTQHDAFKQILKNVDVLIDESFALDPPSYDLNTFSSNVNVSASSSSSFPFMVNKRVWREDRRVASTFSLDWLETAPAQPQIVLQELIGILNPSVSRQPYFFRNIAMGEKVVNVTANACDRDYIKPLAPMVYTCPLSSKNNNSSAPIASAAAKSFLPDMYFQTFSILLIFILKFF